MLAAPAFRLMLLGLPLLVPACAPKPAPTSAAISGTTGATARAAIDPQVTSDCRARADAVYEKQNRADLSRRDQRDSPFSASYNSGITTRGLGARFERDRMVADCVSANSSGKSSAASTGPTFSGQVPY